MISLLVDEAYAFDYLSILEIKAKISDQFISNYNDCCEHIKLQLSSDFNTIINSEEYLNLICANQKTFNMVDKAKFNKCSAQDVDKCNYERYKAKVALQKKFFNKSLSEQKIGYEIYKK